MNSEEGRGVPLNRTDIVPGCHGEQMQPILRYKEEGYQGWTNYETWVVKLSIDNEEYSYNYWQGRAAVLKEEGAIADELKETFEGNNPLEDAGLYTDLLNSALGEVNWDEIANSILEEASE